MAPPDDYDTLLDPPSGEFGGGGFKSLFPLGSPVVPPTPPDPAPAVAIQYPFGPDFFTRRTNCIPDPGFEYGALRNDYRYAAASVTDSSAVVAAPVIRGLHSLRVSCSANANGGTGLTLVAVGWRADAEEDQPWSAAALADVISDNFEAHIRLRFLDDTLTELTSVSAGDGLRGRRVIDGEVAPADTAHVELACVLHLAGASGSVGSALFDDLVLTLGTRATSGALDGESGNARWALMPNLSLPSCLGEDDDFPMMLDWVPPYWYDEPVGAA